MKAWGSLKRNTVAQQLDAQSITAQPVHSEAEYIAALPAPPALGYGAVFLGANKKSIDQAAAETVSLWLLSPACLSASLSVSLPARNRLSPIIWH